jgi:hypothetical protein
MKVPTLVLLLIIETSRDYDSTKAAVSTKESTSETTNVRGKAPTPIRKKTVKNVAKGVAEWYYRHFILIAVLVVSRIYPSQTLPPVPLLLHIYSALAVPNDMPTRELLKRGIFLNYIH